MNWKTPFSASAGIWRSPVLPLRLVEVMVHLGLPVALMLSLLSHCTVLFLRAGPLVGVAYFVFLYRRSKTKRLYRCLVSVLPALLVIAYVDVIWHLYNVGRLQVYTDAFHGYLPQSELPLWDPKLWLFGVKPVVTPLLFKVLHRDMAAVNDVYVTGYLLATLFCAWSVASLFGGLTQKLLAFYLFIAFFLNQSQIGAWLTIAQSEAPTIILTILVFGVYAVVVGKRESIRQSRAKTVASLAVVFLTSAAFSFSRDTNLYFLPLLAVFYLPVFPSAKSKAAVVGLLMSLFCLHLVSLQRSGRWKFALANVLMQRVVPDDELRRLFQASYHLPGDDVIAAAERRWASEEFENKELLFSPSGDGRDWVSRYGLHAYHHFLITHPGYALFEWMKHWEAYNAGFWRWTLRRGPRYRLSFFLFSFPGRIPLFGGLVILIASFLFIRELPVAALATAHAFWIGLIAYHGDAMEVERHLQQAGMTLRMALLLVVTLAFAVTKECFESRLERSRAEGQ